MSPRWCCGVCLVVLLPMTAVGGDGTEQAQQWLRRMVSAVEKLNYEGTFIYQHDARVETMRIVHVADEEGEHERLLSLNGVPREIVRRNNVVTCYLPDQKSVVVEKDSTDKPFPAALPQDTSRLAPYYAFDLKGKERVAGEEAQVVAIRPRDQYRYGYRLWLDTESAMPLRSDLVDEHGKAVEQLMFTSLRLLDKVPEEELEPANSGEGFTWTRRDCDAVETAADARRWQAIGLPPGFTLVQYNRHGMPTSRKPVDHLMFSDGLASASVYVEQLEPDGKHRLSGASRMGAVNAYATVLDSHSVTVVGEVPQATVQMIGRAIRPIPAPEAGD